MLSTVTTDYTCYYTNPKILILQMPEGHGLPIYTCGNPQCPSQMLPSPRFSWAPPPLSKLCYRNIVFAPLWHRPYSTDHYGYLTIYLSSSCCQVVRSWVTRAGSLSSLKAWHMLSWYTVLVSRSPLLFLQTKHLFYLERLLIKYNWFQTIIKIRLLFSKYLHSLFP